MPRDVLQFVAVPRRRGRPPADHAPRRRHRGPHRRATRRRRRSSTGSRRCACSPRRAARTRSSSPAAADEDAAIRDLVRSAFGHAGQKCSAASLAIVEAPVYDDPVFRRRLADAVAQRPRRRPPTDLATMMGPLIGAPSPDLRRALTTLDPGEAWLVEPRCLDARRHAVDAGRAPRRAARFVVPPHRVLRAGARA